MLRRIRRTLLAGAIVGTALLSTSLDNPSRASQVASHTLRVFVPGSFSGCSSVALQTSPALRAVLDLTRPSAFVPNAQGRLVGTGGAVSSAELISLKPQTVTYGINTSLLWSNGDPFSAADLTSRIKVGQQSQAAWAIGYHHVVSYSVAPNGRSVTVVFDSHYSDWPVLFRDLEHGATSTCSLDDELRRPSLGAYLLESLSPTQAVLEANPQFASLGTYFTTVVVNAGDRSSSQVSGPVVDYRYKLSDRDLVALAGRQDRGSRMGSSNRLLAVTFSSASNMTSSQTVRKVLSWSVDRAHLINTLYGSRFQGGGIALSSLISQGQSGYPTTNVSTPLSYFTTTTTTPPEPNQGSQSFECAPCATRVRGDGVQFRGQQLFYRGRSVSLTLGVGPSPDERAAAAVINRTWSRLGVLVYQLPVASPYVAATLLRQGVIDAYVGFTFTGIVGVSAMSWSGASFADSVDFGWRSVKANEAALVAESTFNPSDALNSWEIVDNEIAANYWQRPIVSAPYVVQWTFGISGVAPSTTIDGLLNQAPTWTYVSAVGS